MIHLAKTLFLDYKWSQSCVCNFTKYTAMSRLSRLVNKSFFELGNAVRLTLRTSLRRRTNVFCLHYLFSFLIFVFFNCFNFCLYFFFFFFFFAFCLNSTKESMFRR